jgi:ATP-binding cassette, subfamily B, bacterial
MRACIDFRRLGRELRLLCRRARQAWRLIPARRKLILGGAAFVMALTSSANTIVAVLLGSLVDSVQQNYGRPLTEVYWIAGGILATLAGVYLVREALHILRRGLVDNACTKINRDMQIRMVQHVMRSDLNALAGEKLGTLHGKIFRNVDGLVRFLRLMFLDCLPAILIGVFALSMAISRQPVLGFVMLGVVPMAVLLTMRQLQTQKRVRLKLMRDCEIIDGTVVEQLSGAEYVRVANTYKQEIGRLGRRASRRRRRELQHHFQMSLYGCAKALNEGLFHIIVLGIAVYLAAHGVITFGDILMFSVLFMSVMTPLAELHRVLDEGHEASLRVGDMIRMLREPEDASFLTKPHGAIALVAEKPALHVRDLHVHYRTPDGKRRRALNGVSFTIRHGETVGIAGRSGSGKSTFVKVLLRLTHPDSGLVKLGDRTLDNVSREELARQIGYVGQTPFVFSGSIAQNIAYGTGTSCRAKIEEAARLAHLHDEILDMPGGYDFRVSERGQNLSGGQRQRLALARILLKNAPFLILDEATSALDNLCERHIQRSLRLTARERTTILIAHRLTTLKDCDRILVFEDGRITQAGTYQELLNEEGVFEELVRSAEGTREWEPTLQGASA